jgi:protein SCO1/2
VDPARGELTIKHGDIHGFMPGMTMPFKVENPRLLDGRTPGDLVTATLVVKDSTAYLSAVKGTGHAPLTEPPPSMPRMELIEPGTEVPDLTLTDESGTQRRLADWRNKVVAVTFTYTRCPLPDFCLRMDQNFSAVQRGVLADARLRGRAALLSISFDPKFDTPQVLAEHARHAGADPRVWRFATGDPDAIEKFASRFGISVIREGGDLNTITHNLRTAVIGPDGRLISILTGNDWTPAALLDALRRASE